MDKMHVERFSIQSGTWQQDPANIRLVDASSRRYRRSRGSLYLLSEPVRGSPVSPAILGELLDLVVDTYYEASGSITRGLREALLAANGYLFEANLRANSDHRLLLGLNCAIIRDSDVYLAQLGPALATWQQQGRLERFPADSIWLRSESPSAFDLGREPPAGLRKDVEPDLYHLVLDEAMVLVLSTTALERICSPTERLRVLSHSGVDGIGRNLETLANGRDLSAIVINPSGGQRQEPPSPKGRPSGKSEQAEPRAPTPEAPAPSLAEPGKGRTTAAQEAAQPTAESMRGDALPVAPRVERLPDASQPAWDDAAPIERPRERQIDLSQVRAGLGEGAGKLRQGAGDLLLQVLPESMPERPPTREKTSAGMPLGGWALVAVALAIPLVMLALVILTRLQYDRAQHDQFASIRTIAQTRYDQAMGVQDRDYTRRVLYEALQAVDDGLAISPNDEDLVALKRRIQVRLDEIDSVQRLYHFWQLAVLDDVIAAPVDSSRIIAEGIDLFLLNRGSDRVYHFMLNDVGDALQPMDKSPLLVQKGHMQSGVRVGDMVDIAWLEAGGQRTLSTFVMLERGGSLLAYQPQQGIDVLPVADSESWLKPQAIGGYFGNLYLLDPLQSRILKYVPTDNSYITSPSDYLNPQVAVDLTGAVDMAIDGNIYVLFADGKVAKFYQGDAQPFSLAGLPTPMRNPTTIFVSGPRQPDGAGSVYITDTGNERILQFDKNGNFVRQLRAKDGEPQMSNLRGVFVDEQRQRMFLLSGKTLWLCDLPKG
jgi:hypothetical protein